ncbi:MAG TPA: autotransporter-associated beta strand repeat-containing protein [Terrimicrobiaceae bacterium]|nr:autotransporter-associated beta strand repeat-containing protein [Terrimicrobiaceae bacterium]
MKIHRFPVFRTPQFLALLAALAVSAPLTGRAASYTFTGSAGASSWDSPTNWMPASPVAGGSSTDELYFSFSNTAVTVSNNNFSGTFVLNKLAITSVAGANKQISGNGLEFVNNGTVGPRMEQNGSIQSSIANTISIGSGVNLTLGGSSPNTVTTLSGKISGAGSITIENSPWVFNNAANDFSGGITMTAGQLVAQTSNAFGTGTLTLQGGALRATTTASVTVANTVLIGGNLQLGSSSGTASKLTLTGNTTLTGGAVRTLTISGTTGATPVVFAGAIGESGGSSGLTIVGSGNGGILEFSGSSANTYSGLTSVTNSTATLLLNKTGANAIAGNLTLTIGTVRLGQSNQIADSSTVSLSGGTFDLNGRSDTVGLLLGTGGVITTSTSGTSTLTTNGVSGTTVTLASSLQDGAGTLALVKGGNDALILTGLNSHSGGTTLNSGQLVLSGTSALGTGALILNGGILRTTDSVSRTYSNAVQIGGDLQIGIGTTQSTLTLTGSTTILGSGATRAIAVNGSGTNTSNFNPVIFGGPIGDGGNNNGLLIQGVAAGNSTRVFFGLGAADTAANTYTGLTTVGNSTATIATLVLDKADGTNAVRGDLTVANAGAVSLNRANQIADTSTVTVSGGNLAFAPGSGTSDNGVNETISNLTMTAGTLNTDPSAAGGSNTVTVNNTLAFSGGVLRINPTSTVVANAVQVSGTNTSGFRLGGTLEVGSGGLTLTQSDFAPDSGSGFFNIMQFAAGNSNDGVDVGTVQGGTMKLNGNITTVASATNTNGLRISVGAGGTNSSIDLNGGNRTFNVANGAADIDLQINPRLTDSVGGGSFTKTGAGTLVLDGGGAGGNYAGPATINAGTLRYVAGAINTLSGAVTVDGSTAVLDMNGRTDTVSSVILANNATIQSSTPGGVLTSTGGFDVRSGLISAAIAGNGLTKSTSGTVSLTAANSYTGTTSVSAGTLVLSGNGAVSSSTLIDVAAGATFDVAGVTGGYVLASGQTLKGNGTIRGSATIEGTLAPGASPGLLTFENALVLGATSETFMEIVGTSRGVAGGYDAVDVGTSLSYGGDLILTMTSGISLGTYDLFDFTSQSGDFATVSFAGGFYAGTFTNNGSGLWSATDTNGSGQTFQFSQATGDLSVVPEPATAVLAGFGLAGVLVWTRRSRRRG